MELGALFSELKQRKVIRFSVVYLLVGWGVVQGAATVFPPLRIPDWGISLVLLLTILGLPIGIMLAWTYDITPQGVRRTGRRRASSKATAAAGASAAERPKSIAVLPFVNMSGDEENEYFSDGITEEILNALVRVKNLQVASRTSSFAFKGKEIDVRDAGDRLNAAAVLEGSVRKAGTRLRITAQLIDVESGYHLWSETYDRELADVFAIQDEIARAIVDALKVQLGGEAEAPLVAPATQNIEAYTKYLKGRFFFSKLTEQDLRRSLELYEAALAIDPNYAHAWAGIADSWMNLADDWVSPLEAYPHAKQAAVKAINLDPSLAEAHTALGKGLGWYEWDFNGAELALRRAVAANPKYADAHWGLGSILPANGRLEEGLATMQHALTLDPLSALFSGWVARFYVYLRRFDEALKQCSYALELDAYHPRVYLWMGLAYVGLHEYEKALETFRRSAETIAFHNLYMVQPLLALGRRDEALETVRTLERDAERLYIRNELLAAAFGAIGEMDKAFSFIDRAIESHSAGLIYLNTDPVYDVLRPDPRFTAALSRIGLR